jgi:hypothetical protein
LAREWLGCRADPEGPSPILQPVSNLPQYSLDDRLVYDIATEKAALSAECRFCSAGRATRLLRRSEYSSSSSAGYHHIPPNPFDRVRKSGCPLFCLLSLIWCFLPPVCRLVTGIWQFANDFSCIEDVRCTLMMGPSLGSGPDKRLLQPHILRRLSNAHNLYRSQVIFEHQIYHHRAYATVRRP